MSYAENTSVSVTKTKADIEELIIKAGAGQFLSGYKENMAVIGFSLANRQIRFVLPDGKTIGEFMAPQLETVYEAGKMPPLLPMLN